MRTHEVRSIRGAPRPSVVHGGLSPSARAMVPPQPPGPARQGRHHAEAATGRRTGSAAAAEQAAARLARLLVVVVLRLGRCGGLDEGGYGGSFPAGEVVGVTAAHGRVADLPGVPGCGGLLPAVVGELPLHRAGGTNPVSSASCCRVVGHSVPTASPVGAEWARDWLGHKQLVDETVPSERSARPDSTSGSMAG